MPVPPSFLSQHVNPTLQWIMTTAMFVAAIGITVLVLKRERGARAKTLGIMVLLGGGLSVCFEPLGDYLGLVWHPEIGQWTAFHQYGRAIPLWIVPTYYWFNGGQTLYVLQRIRGGATKKQLWHMFHAIMVIDGILELPPLYAHIYGYYGNQPFFSYTYFPIPLWFLVQNGVWPLICSLAVLSMLKLGGPRMIWGVPFGVAGAAFCGYMFPSWPTFAGLNSGAGWAVMYPLNILSIGLVFLAVYLIIQAIDHLAGPGKQIDFLPGTDRPLVAADGASVTV
jgi:hypothetical protein